jgi:diadenosine tetraphosphate (Ap4A) HIT family hydrolase/ADP-ribose pyrophosphatase YjhB (NUDIX family)
MNCVFCNPSKLSDKIIFQDNLILSFVPEPRAVEDAILVIPRRHVERIAELTDDESTAIMREVGRIGETLDNGSGSGLMQKFQPLQEENGIKVNHLHFHVFPRAKGEKKLFPVPDPNDFSGMKPVSKDEVSRLINLLRNDNPRPNISLRIAMKAAIFNSQNELLLLRYKKTHYNKKVREKWGLPGGKIKADEPLLDGLRREISEETGLKNIDIGAPFAISEWWPTKNNTKLHIVATFLMCRTTFTGGGVVLSKEHDDFAWVTRDDLSKFDIMSPESQEIPKAFERLKND